jgi:hypothetical protein
MLAGEEQEVACTACGVQDPEAGRVSLPLPVCRSFQYTCHQEFPGGIRGRQVSPCTLRRRRFLHERPVSPPQPDLLPEQHPEHFRQPYGGNGREVTGYPFGGQGFQVSPEDPVVQHRFTARRYQGFIPHAGREGQGSIPLCVQERGGNPFPYFGGSGQIPQGSGGEKTPILTDPEVHDPAEDVMDTCIQFPRPEDRIPEGCIPGQGGSPPIQLGEESPFGRWGGTTGS